MESCQFKAAYNRQEAVQRVLSLLMVCSLALALFPLLLALGLIPWSMPLALLWGFSTLVILGWLMFRYRKVRSENQMIVIEDDSLYVPRILGGLRRFSLLKLISVENLLNNELEVALILRLQDKVPFYLEKCLLADSYEYQRLVNLLRSYATKNTTTTGLSQGEIRVAMQRPNEVALHLLAASWVLLYLLSSRESGFQSITESMLESWGNHSGTLLTPQFYQVFSAAFLHLNIPHLLVNVALLGLVGPAVLRLLGSTALVALLLFSALMGNLASNLYSGFVVSLGASGGLYGLLGCYILLQMRYRDLMPGSTVFASNRLLLGMLLLECILKLTAVPNLDLWAHAGGFIAGMLAAWGLVPKERLFAGPSRLELVSAWVLGIAFLFACSAFLFSLR